MATVIKRAAKSTYGTFQGGEKWNYKKEPTVPVWLMLCKLGP